MLSAVPSIFRAIRFVDQDCLPCSVGPEVLVIEDDSIRVLGDSPNFAPDLHSFTFYHWDLVSRSMVEVDRFANIVILPEEILCVFSSSSPVEG